VNIVIKVSGFPPKSAINESFGKIDYLDTYKAPIYNYQDYSIDYITALFFTSLPAWVKVLLSFRNFIVKFFGLQGGDINKLKEPDKSIYFAIGSKAVIFKVHNRNINEIVMAEKDKHLNFRTSLLIEDSTDKDFGYLYCSTIVQYNNIFGKLYFLPVKPFHKLIIKTMLKIVSKKLKQK
jgi:hypothetical protein